MRINPGFCKWIISTVAVISMKGAAAQSDSVTMPRDTVHTKNRHILVFPLVANSIETSLSFGGAASITFRSSHKDTLSRTSSIQALALYSLDKQLVTAVNGTQYFARERYILNEQLSYSSFPDKFWGIGKNTPDANEEAYKFEQYYIYLHLMRSLGHNFFGGILFEFQNVMKVDYNKGGIFDQQLVAGRNGYKASGFGLSFTYDDRNDAFAPDKGSFAQFFFNHFDHVFGSGYNYTNYVIDLRKFIRIYHHQVLALQAFSFTNVGDSIPLRSLATFGGATSMRGYYDGRYRDKNQLVFQAEYRVPLFKRFGAVVFANCGDVAHTPFDYTFDDLKFSYGGGLRFALNKSEKLNLRLDYGIGKGDNSGLYFQLGEAF